MNRARPASRMLLGLAALITLLALVVGLPLVLYRVGGSPVPARIPAWHQVTRALMRPDSGGLFLAAVRDISWLAWAAFTVAVVAEVQAALRGRTAPRLGLGGLQAGAGRLVALTLIAFSGPGTALLTMSQAMPVAAVAVQPAAPQVSADALPAAALWLPARDLPGQHAAETPVSQVMSTGFYQVVTVKPGDCLWTIAEHYLGEGDLYPEIAKLNIGHDMGGGHIFTDPSLIWPGWMLQLPAGSQAGHPPAHHAGSGDHAAHPSRQHRFRRPHPAAPARTSPPPVAAAPAGGGTQGGRSAAAGSTQAGQPGSEHSEQLPALAIFAAGLLAGGAAVTLARMRNRQRQSRRPGRRIPLPASAPVIAAERRLSAQVRSDQALRPPTTALRAALSDLGAFLVTSGRRIPDITGIRLLPSAMELLLAIPAGGPPPPRFTAPAGRQGMAWMLELPGNAPAEPFAAARAGDLLPGLLTVGVADGGYLLIDLEYLRVTIVDGPAALADEVLATAAAELATSELAGWYDLILVGFGELDGVGSRATSCPSFEEALDLIAAKAVTVRRRLDQVGHADVRGYRLADPGNEDWALSLLVSRYPPTSDQLALLLDLAGEPGGIAALVPGGVAAPAGHLVPASMRLAADPGSPGGIVADIVPLGLRAWPQPLDECDYASLASMFATAAEQGDVAADEPPYDGSSWPPLPGGPAAAAGLGVPEAQAGHEADPQAQLSQEPQAGRESGATGERAAEPARQAGGHDAGQPSLRIGILGTLTINGATGVLTPAESQLVVALALSGQDGLSNQRLCYLLGAGPDHPKPSDALRQLVARTRRQLGRAPDGGDWIEHRGAGQYALHPQSRFDWPEFEALAAEGMRARDAGLLRQALRLIRGRPFADGCHWSVDLALIESVRAQIVDAAQLLAGLELAARDWAGAAWAARTGLAGDPGAEQLWRALMRAEHADGNLAAVREAWSRCLDELAAIAPGAEPQPETATLYRELTQGSEVRQVLWRT